MRTTDGRRRHKKLTWAILFILSPLHLYIHMVIRTKMSRVTWNVVHTNEVWNANNNNMQNTVKGCAFVRVECSVYALICIFATVVFFLYNVLHVHTHTYTWKTLETHMRLYLNLFYDQSKFCNFNFKNGIVLLLAFICYVYATVLCGCW